MSKPEPADLIELPVPFSGGKSVRFSGAMVFFALLNLGIAYLYYDQLRGIHGALQELACSLQLDMYMYTRTPENVRLYDMPRSLFTCLPEWLKEQPNQQIAPQ